MKKARWTFSGESWDPEDPLSASGEIIPGPDGIVDLGDILEGEDTLSKGMTWVELAPELGEAIWSSVLAKGVVPNDGVLELPWSAAFLFDPSSLSKAGAPKYIKRVPTGNPKRPWRYYYAVHHGGGVANAEHFAEGARFSHGGGHYTIHAVKDGKLTVSHSSGGRKVKMTHDQLAAKLAEHHRAALDAHKEKLSREHAAAVASGNVKGAAKIREEAKRIGHVIADPDEKKTVSPKAKALSDKPKAKPEPPQPSAPRVESRKEAVSVSRREPSPAETKRLPTDPHKALAHIAENHPDEHVRAAANASLKASALDPVIRRNIEQHDGEAIAKRAEMAGKVRRDLADIKSKHGEDIHAAVEQRVRKEGLSPDVALERELKKRAAAKEAAKPPEQPPTPAPAPSSSSSPPSSVEEHLNAAAKLYGLSDKDVSILNRHDYLDRARKDPGRAKDWVRLAVKEHISRDPDRNMSVSRAERFMREREKRAALQKALVRLLRSAAR
jgi:hypothetical protein